MRYCWENPREDDDGSINCPGWLFEDIAELVKHEGNGGESAYYIYKYSRYPDKGPAAAATSRNFGSGFPSNLYDMKAALARERDIGYTYLLTFYFLIMGGGNV